jgi:hypothetical protein
MTLGTCGFCGRRMLITSRTKLAQCDVVSGEFDDDQVVRVPPEHPLAGTLGTLVWTCQSCYPKISEQFDG